MNIQAAITFELNGFEISWHAHVVAPNEAHDFIPTPPGEPEAQLGYLDRLTERYDRIRLDASYSDALGKSHETHESIEIREWWGSLKSAGHLVTQDYPAETVNELAKIGTAVGKIASEAAKERLRLQLLRGPWRWEIRIRRLPSRLQPIARRVARRIGISRV